MNAPSSPSWQLGYATPVRHACLSFDSAITVAECVLVAYMIVLILVAKAYYPDHLQRLVELL